MHPAAKWMLEKEKETSEKQIARIRSRMETAARRALDLPDGAFERIIEGEALTSDRQHNDLDRQHGVMEHELTEIMA